LILQGIALQFDAVCCSALHYVAVFTQFVREVSLCVSRNGIPWRCRHGPHGQPSKDSCDYYHFQSGAAGLGPAQTAAMFRVCVSILVYV